MSLFDETSSPEEWNYYVSTNSASCIHHRVEWRNILSQSYGHESLYLCARNDSQSIVGILPLIHMKSRLFGNKLVSLPFFQRGGAIADSPLIESELLQAASTYGSKLGVDFIEYRDDIPRENLPGPSAVQTHKVNMVLALPETQETLWQGFTSKLRAQIRRAQREQPQVFIGGKEYLNDFYTIYSRNMRDLGSPVQSKHFIKNILLNFPDNSWLIIIKLQQRPVAAGFLLGSGDTMEIPLASTIRDVNHLSMNMFLYWEVLRFAIKQNYSQFDFGRSSKNAGTYRFKQQWGAQPKQLYWHYWLGNSAAPPSLNPANPKYALIIKVWKRLPVVLANLLGPAIVKNLP
ncbi:MAG: FemAB family PEP-CTERM system-associated protein [Gammaproteobacteria bacterium]|nr:FemAB family PEP-CTERM system-associated protein [Gammaproteobacteria bacterium]